MTKTTEEIATIIEHIAYTDDPDGLLEELIKGSDQESLDMIDIAIQVSNDLYLYMYWRYFLKKGTNVLA